MPNIVVPNVLSKDLHRDVVAACGPDCFIGTGITDNLIVRLATVTTRTRECVHC